MKFAILISLLYFFVSTGCKKEPVRNSAPMPSSLILNTPPKVSAGGNIQLVLPTDSSVLTGAVTASGSKIKSYLWEKTNGPAAFKIEHPDSLITSLRALQEGSYTFQLTVTDSSGLQGKASVGVTVYSITAFEYNLDLDIHTGYKFLDNEKICLFGPECYYADETTIAAYGQLSPSDNLQVNISEESDSAAQSYKVYNGNTSFYLTNQFQSGASGPSVFNLKKTIQQGGGSFTGTIKLNSSSALNTWRENAFKALPALTVTGKLDTTTHTVNMQIKGKIIF